jgi:hypothetical protein
VRVRNPTPPCPDTQAIGDVRRASIYLLAQQLVQLAGVLNHVM